MRAIENLVIYFLSHFLFFFSFLVTTPQYGRGMGRKTLDH